MTPFEEELLTRYLTHLNVLGEDGDFADFEEWYSLSATPTAPVPRAPWRRHRSCATRTSWRPPGCSTGCRGIRNQGSAGQGRRSSPSKVAKPAGEITRMS